MATVEHDMSEELLSRLKRELEETLHGYRKAAELRSKKIEQEREQIEVYVDLLENKLEMIKLNRHQIKKIDKVLSRKSKIAKISGARRKQDLLEDRFLELQKLLVNLLSKRFKY
jgi:hypothetical protein